MSKHPIFGHSGDLGDIIPSLPTARALGGGDYAIFDRPTVARESLKGARFEAIKPLLEAQPYIGQATWHHVPVETVHDFSTFRHDFIANENLADWQARHLGVTITTDPWLVALRSPKGIGRTVVSRSLRYHNHEFPWRRIAAKHRADLLFVGMPEEYRAFQIANGCLLEYCPTSNLLELAEVIAGADRFIGNQSCPFWIAAGLGVPLIQEVNPSPYGANSVVKRRNAKYLLRQPFPI